MLKSSILRLLLCKVGLRNRPGPNYLLAINTLFSIDDPESRSLQTPVAFCDIDLASHLGRCPAFRCENPSSFLPTKILSQLQDK